MRPLGGLLVLRRGTEKNGVFPLRAVAIDSTLALKSQPRQKLLRILWFAVYPHFKV